jgi:large subunit ribosomal protein L9
MEVILKEDISKLGSRGEVVSVAEGYGRNYLLPKKLAVRATKQNKAVIEQMKAAAVRRHAKEQADAELLAKQFEGLRLEFTRKAGENDTLFGSVTSADIGHELEAKGFSVDRRKIDLEQPIKSLGEFTVPIKLHKQVTVQIQVAVAKENEEPAV